MKKEIIYRVMRILFVITILLVGTFLRNEVKESYEQSKIIMKELNTNLELTKLDEEVTDKNNKLTSSYTLQVKNNTRLAKEFSFEIINEEINNNCIDYSNVKYQVLQNNKILKEGTLKNNNNLYNGTQEGNSTGIYEIKFLITKKEEKSKKFLTKIALI